MQIDGLILHKAVIRSLEQQGHHPAHAVLLVGPTGSGKAALARTLAARVLHLTRSELETYPYQTAIAPVDGKAIPIESIRDLQHFLTLKIPGASAAARTVIIEDAQLLTPEAQNALLKTLEEPPEDTVIILTATTAEALLATVRSRVRQLQVVPPDATALRQLYTGRGIAAAEVDKALMLSGGMPGLAEALLTGETAHPLYEATIQARAILQSSPYQRLAMVDVLSKQKQLSLHIVFILGEMARLALLRSTDTAGGATARWRRILQASYAAQRQLMTNAQPKLILINLMLAL